jgi:hypothetical protein
MQLRRIDLRRLSNIAIALTAAGGAGSALVGMGSPWSIVAGGGVMLANYHLIRMLVSQLINPRSDKVWALFLFIGKLGLFFVLVAGAFYRLPIEPMSFAFGATALLLATIIEAVFMGKPLGPLNEDGNGRIT